MLIRIDLFVRVFCKVLASFFCIFLGGGLTNITFTFLCCVISLCLIFSFINTRDENGQVDVWR